jgi:ribosome-associated toxin RatA of RatAB toxin-antitoxin module
MAIREIKRSALVTFSPAQMFDLVIDVERYPQFLPWVAGAALHQRSEHDLLASMEMRRSGVTERFTTRNEFDRPSFMTMQLVEGPFRVLYGRWTFTPIGDLDAVRQVFRAELRPVDRRVRRARPPAACPCLNLPSRWCMRCQTANG